MLRASLYRRCRAAGTARPARQRGRPLPAAPRRDGTMGEVAARILHPRILHPRSRARAWIEPMARFGFTARALVYMLVGVLAATAALGAHQRATDAHGAIRAMGRQPYGTALLFVVGLGLAAYAVWRFLQAGLDLDGKGRDLDGLLARAGFMASGLVHAGLAYSSFSLAVGLRRGRSAGVREWATRLMDAPL